MNSGKSTKIVREHMPYGRVLVVDDVDFNLLVTKGLLKPYGLMIETAISGYKALEKIRNGNTYDIIFMDQVMPEMDGIETTKRIREEGYKYPIIAFSANATSDQSETFLKNGHDDFISKPLNVRDLNDMLNKWIRDKQTPNAQCGNPDCVSSDTAEHVAEDLISSEEHTSIIKKLKDISYLNIDSALDDVSGLIDVFVDSIKLTARRLPDTVKKMDDFISAGDIKAFTTTVHGLIGVLKSIGASSLGNVAVTLEHAGLNNDISFCKEFYPSFKDSLLSLSVSLTAALPDNNSMIKRLGDKTALTQILAEVKTAAEDYNRNLALGLIAPLKDFTYDESTDTLLKKIFIDLEEYDCEGALDTIERLKTDYCLVNIENIC